MTTQYLPLADYSSKYKVSISTLRRRIKAEDICFVFEDGKYLIQDDPMSTHQRVNRPSPRISDATWMGAHQEPVVSTFSYNANGDSNGIVRESAPMFGRAFQPEKQEPVKQNQEPAKPEAQDQEPVLTVANRLLTELKKAYSQILHEKEEQILHLKEELLDLKTLARVLESENDRLSRQQKS